MKCDKENSDGFKFQTWFHKHDNWGHSPHQGIQGGHRLIYTGHLGGNQTHAHITQRPEPDH